VGWTIQCLKDLVPFENWNLDTTLVRELDDFNLSVDLLNLALLAASRFKSALLGRYDVEPFLKFGSAVWLGILYVLKFWLGSFSATESLVSNVEVISDNESMASLKIFLLLVLAPATVNLSTLEIPESIASLKVFWLLVFGTVEIPSAEFDSVRIGWFLANGFRHQLKDGGCFSASFSSSSRAVSVIGSPLTLLNWLKMKLRSKSSAPIQTK